LSNVFPKYLKVANIAMVHVFGYGGWMMFQFCCIIE
jgi:hypothetical protein